MVHASLLSFFALLRVLHRSAPQAAGLYHTAAKMRRPSGSSYATPARRVRSHVKGVSMKKLALMFVLGIAGLACSATSAKADWGCCHYGGYSPKWCFWSRHCKPGCCSEEERWQRFWHDYYHALHVY